MPRNPTAQPSANLTLDNDRAGARDRTRQGDAPDPPDRPGDPSFAVQPVEKAIADPGRSDHLIPGQSEAVRTHTVAEPADARAGSG
ncbi:hypothetical protein GCM10010343_36340 [Streptomyces avidinii]|nr:hypothetical protein GCM10010343_36340 [Streptomyces avidinii]